jgi:hypothetical protein
MKVANNILISLRITVIGLIIITKKRNIEKCFNVVHKRAAYLSEQRTLPTKTLAQRQHVMP